MVPSRLKSVPQAIDRMPRSDAVLRLVLAQEQAVACVKAVAPQLLAAATAVSDSFAAEARVVYVAAGSSGLMALADAAELPGTFGLSPSQIRIVMAGGVPTTAQMPGDTEDGTDALDDGLSDLGAKDTVIVLSASGTTPFALAAAERARVAGCTVISIATREGSPLLKQADIAILLKTPAEALEGSTRLGAGTAQKIALNTISTMAGIQLGHVHDGLMVNLRADNAKLRLRARAIVTHLGQTNDAAAEAALDDARGDTKLAILIARGTGRDQGRALLESTNGDLKPILTDMPGRTDT